ncbi:unnamed protein product, partial [Meganyctiphanes norvegica]
HFAVSSTGVWHLVVKLLCRSSELLCLMVDINGSPKRNRSDRDPVQQPSLDPRRHRHGEDIENTVIYNFIVGASTKVHLLKQQNHRNVLDVQHDLLISERLHVPRANFVMNSDHRNWW